MVAGSKRRRVEEAEPITYQNLSLTCEKIEHPRDSCLIALLYLSARRISEILHLQKKDFKVEDNRISFETFNEKVYRKKPMGNYRIYRNNWYYEVIRPHWRTDTLSGKSLSKYVLQRLGSVAEKNYVFKSIRGEGYIGRSMAYKIVKYYLPNAWPHLLRHYRITEIVNAYKDDPVATHLHTFHKRFESTLQYYQGLEEERI